MLRPIKDNLGLKASSIYRFPREWSKGYIGATGRTMETRCKKHIPTRHTYLGQPDELAQQHILWIKDIAKFHSSWRLDKAAGCINHTAKEATEIHLHPNNFNWDGSFTLRWTWQPVLKYIQASSKDNQDLAQSPSDSVHQPKWLATNHEASLVHVYKQGGLDVESHHSPDDGDGAGLWNVGLFEPHYVFTAILLY